MFYKETLVQLVEQSTIVSTEYLHNESSFPYSLGWMQIFWVQLSGQDGDTYREPYYIRRVEDVEAINNPRSYTDIID